MSHQTYILGHITINNVNGGAQSDLHMLRVSCDVLPTKQQCSCGADLLTVSEYRINKHFTRVQAQVTGHAGVKVQTLNVFYLEHIV